MIKNSSHFRQEQCIWLPVEQAFVKDFLGMNAGAEDPNRGMVCVSFLTVSTMKDICDHGGQKGLRRLDYVGKSNGPCSPLDSFESASDWVARCDALQKLRRFFHRKLYAKSANFVAASL